MNRWLALTSIFAALLISSASASAQEAAKLSEHVVGMPKGEKQQIRQNVTRRPGSKNHQ